jgi:hypothetical protein
MMDLRHDHGDVAESQGFFPNGPQCLVPWKCQPVNSGTVEM